MIIIFFAWFVNKKKFVFSRFVSFSFCLHSYKHNIHTYTVGSLFGNHSLCVSVCLMFSVCVFLLRIVWNWLKNWIEKTEKIIFNNLSSMMMMAQQQQQRLAIVIVDRIHFSGSIFKTNCVIDWEEERWIFKWTICYICYSYY